MFNKKITVIITSYNSEKYLKESISSVINQTYKNLEIIIVDDGSNDNSKRIISFFQNQDKRIRTIFLKKNSGSEAVTRNIGIKKSKGEYISFLDADDIWLPKKLETQIQYFNKSKIMFATLCKYIDDKGNFYSGFLSNFLRKIIQNFIFKLGLKGLYIYNPFILSSVLIKKKVLKKYYFTEDKYIVGVADLKLWLDILKNNSIHKVTLINSFLVKIRRRNDSMNINYTQASTRSIYAISNFFLYHKDFKNFYLFVLGILFKALKVLYKLLYFQIKRFFICILLLLTFTYFLIFISPAPWFLTKELIHYDNSNINSEVLVILTGNGDSDYINTGYQKRYLDTKILIKKNIYKKIYLMGREQEIPEYEILRSLLVFDGFDKNNIIILKQASSTYGNMQLIYKELTNKKISTFHFLTAPYHTKRSYLIWKKNFFDIEIEISENIDNPLKNKRWNYSYKEIKVIFYECIAIFFNKLQKKL
jgi:teichuronic acid biosynthesis glycosyltransferase TuaG